MADVKVTLKRVIDAQGNTDNIHPTTDWDQVENKPSTFTPTAHSLNTHTDVDANPTAAGQVLTWDATNNQWIAADSAGGGSVSKLDLQNVYIYGKASVAITKGQAIQFAGVEGDHILIKPAVPSEINAEPTLMIGIAETDAAINDFIYVIVNGRLNLDTSTYTAGDLLYFASAGSTAGALTTTEPTDPNASIQMAAVSIDGVGNGEFIIRNTILTRQINEVIGLQGALDSKVNKSGDTMGGNLRIESGSFASLILDREGSTTTSNVVQFENNNGIVGGIGGFGNDGLQFRTTDGTQMVIDADNNVGIGTTSPTGKLNIVDGSTRGLEFEEITGGVMRILSYDRTNSVEIPLELRGDFIDFETAGTRRFLITDSGVDVSGNIAVSGTVDGVDISAFKSSYDSHNHNTLYYTKSQTDANIAAIVDSSPATLDTLNELAAALGDDPNFATTVSNSIGTKVSKAGDTMTGSLQINSSGTIGGTTLSNGWLKIGTTLAMDTNEIYFGTTGYIGTTTANDLIFMYQATERARLTSAGVDVSGNLGVTGTVDGVDIASFKSAYDSHNHDGRYYTESEANSRFINASGDTMTGTLTIDVGTVNAMRLYTEQGTGRIADTFADNSTFKSYIYFDPGTSSNDPGYIMHESSDSETNEAVLHLVPSDDNAYGDYVSIHGTNDPDVLRLHTDGTIEGVNNLTANNLFVNDYIYHAGDTNTYIRFVGGDDMQLVAGGRQMLRMDEGTDPDRLRFVTDSDWTDSSGNWNMSGSLTVSGDVLLNNAALTYEGQGGVAVPVPQGGIFVTTSSTMTGYLKITLPVSWTNTMLSFFVDVYEYTTDETFTIQVAGYNYGSSSSWINTTANLVSSSTGRLFNVRFGHDGSKCAIYVGESNSTWSYPQVRVRDFLGGYSNDSAGNWADNWAVGFTTSLGTITSTQALESVVSYADSAGNADTVDGLHESTFMRRSANSTLDMNNNDIVGVDQIIHEGDTNTYIQFHASDQWRVVTGGSERLEVNNSQTTINQPLQINSAATINSDAGSRVLYLKQAAAGTGNIIQFVGASNENTWEVVGRDSNFYIYNNDLSKRSIFIEDSNNRVGINDNTSPATELDVNGSVRASSNMYVGSAIYHDGDTNTYMQFHASDQWRVVTGGGERLEVNNTSTTVQNDLYINGANAEVQGNIIWHEGNLTPNGLWRVIKTGQTSVFGGTGTTTVALSETVDDNDVIAFELNTSSNTSYTNQIFIVKLENSNSTAAGVLYNAYASNTLIRTGSVRVYRSLSTSIAFTYAMYVNSGSSSEAADTIYIGRIWRLNGVEGE